MKRVILIHEAKRVEQGRSNLKPHVLFEPRENIDFFALDLSKAPNSSECEPNKIRIKSGNNRSESCYGRSIIT